MKTLVKGGTIVTDGRSVPASILIENGTITELTTATVKADEVIDAEGCLVLPGLIDDHVHFREPGLTDKADILTESRAAVAGGVTSCFDMPNTLPQTTTLEALDDKFRRARGRSHANYSFFYGATDANADTFPQLDPRRIPGVKLFMGSSTGNMLVDSAAPLDRIFSACCLPLMVHCEDTTLINRNMAEAKRLYGDDPDVRHHHLIRSAEACYQSTARAVALARAHGTRLHVAHLTTERELQLFRPADPLVTAEATVGHLLFTHDDHRSLGAKIKVNPAIKTEADRLALRRALTDGRLTVVATDHAPHLLEQKQGGAARAASGMPMVQFSLVAMLSLVDEGWLTVERLVELMCHNPARLFGVERRGFIRTGYRADLVMVRPDAPWKVTRDLIESKCKWSPVEGRTFRWRVERTLCNGHTAYADGRVSDEPFGEPITFCHS